MQSFLRLFVQHSQAVFRYHLLLLLPLRSLRLLTVFDYHLLLRYCLLPYYYLLPLPVVRFLCLLLMFQPMLHHYFFLQLLSLLL